MQVPPLQDRSVKNPNRERTDHLQPGQRPAGEKAADQTRGVKREPQPEQPDKRREQITERRQMIKDGVQLMRLQLPFLNEVHHARDAAERERPVRDH